MGTGGIIVGGGAGTRMGGKEKLLLHLGGTRLVELILHRVRAQVDAIALDVRPLSRSRYVSWEARGISILADPFGGGAGPLGGVVAGLNWLSTLGDEFQWLATFPGDSPFLPYDLVARLRSVIPNGSLRPVVAVDCQRVQSLCALWPANCLPDLSRGIQEGRLRSVRWTLEEFGAIRCPIDAGGSFFNINTAHDLAEARQLVASRSAIVSSA